MPVPETYPNKVTKADFIAVATELNDKVSAVSPLTLIAGAATDIPLIIQGAASQTANLQEWRNSSGTVLANVTPTGSVRVGGNLGVVMASAADAAAGVGASLETNAHTASTRGLVVRGAASQTANLQEWQNSAGTVLTRVASNGRVFAPYFHVGSVGQSWITGEVTDTTAQFVANAANVRALVVRGVASQTANLQEWQDSAGTVLARIESTGVVRTTAVNAFLPASNYIGLIVRGAAGQTANLAEFQNSSGTVLAGITAAGRLNLFNTMGFTSAAAGGVASLPATVSGYFQITNGSTTFHVPYYQAA